MPQKTTLVSAALLILITSPVFAEDLPHLVSKEGDIILLPFKTQAVLTE